VARRVGAFTEHERELLRIFAEQAAASLRNLALHEQVARLAATDGLTGLLNHRRFQEVLGRELRRVERYGTPLSLVMLDLDDFKRVNDMHGHQQGDAVLCAVAARIRACARAVDHAARYGGEELAILLPHMDLEGAAEMAERLRREIEALELPLPDGRSLSVTASAGVASLDAGTRSGRELVATADAALYRAKRAGKNRVVAAERAVPLRALGA